MDFLRCYGLKVKFLVSLVAAVVGISFCVATSKIRKAWAALLYSIGGWLRVFFCQILLNLTRNIFVKSLDEKNR